MSSPAEKYILSSEICKIYIEKTVTRNLNYYNRPSVHKAYRFYAFLSFWVNIMVLGKHMVWANHK